MKNTEGAKEARKGALKRIRDNVEKIYDDYIVNDKIYIFQESYNIKKDFYRKNKDAVSEITDKSFPFER